MSTRTGRRIAIASVVGVVVLMAMLAWLGREHIRFTLAGVRLEAARTRRVLSSLL